MPENPYYRGGSDSNLVTNFFNSIYRVDGPDYLAVWLGALGWTLVLVGFVSVLFLFIRRRQFSVAGLLLVMTNVSIGLYMHFMPNLIDVPNYAYDYRVGVFGIVMGLIDLGYLYKCRSVPFLPWHFIHMICKF